MFMWSLAPLAAPKPRPPTAKDLEPRLEASSFRGLGDFGCGSSGTRVRDGFWVLRFRGSGLGSWSSEAWGFALQPSPRAL